MALRAELYLGGLEIANGYQELVDAAEQAQRFKDDIQHRDATGLGPVPYPSELVTALQHGFPESAGVALGLDRLLMVLLKCERIQDTLSFPIDRA